MNQWLLQNNLLDVDDVKKNEMEQFHAVFLKIKKDKSIWNYHCNLTLILPDVDVKVGLIV